MMFKLSPRDTKLSLTKLWIPGLVSELPHRFATVLTVQLTVMKQEFDPSEIFWGLINKLFYCTPKEYGGINNLL